MEQTAWNFLPSRKKPPIGRPVLVVKGRGRRSFVREAVYKGGGYWSGYGNAPVRAWRPLPHTPISIALEAVLNERDRILDDFDYRDTKSGKDRLHAIDKEIERAQQARESEHERFVRRACEVLKNVEAEDGKAA